MYYGIKILIGPFTWLGWQKDAGWKSYSADDYSPENDVLEKLRAVVSPEDISFLFFSASWCPDSKPEMPKLYKLLNAMDVSFDKVKLFGLDMNKKEPSGLAGDYNIECVPTFVVLKGGKRLAFLVPPIRFT